jgi:hypothetical protein
MLFHLNNYNHEERCKKRLDKNDFGPWGNVLLSFSSCGVAQKPDEVDTETSGAEEGAKMDDGLLQHLFRGLTFQLMHLVYCQVKVVWRRHLYRGDVLHFILTGPILNRDPVRLT